MPYNTAKIIFSCWGNFTNYTLVFYGPEANKYKFLWEEELSGYQTLYEQLNQKAKARAIQLKDENLRLKRELKERKPWYRFRYTTEEQNILNKISHNEQKIINYNNSSVDLNANDIKNSRIKKSCIVDFLTDYGFSLNSAAGGIEVWKQDPFSMV